MGGPVIPDIRATGYTDNAPELTVADRLRVEIRADPSHLDVVTGYIAPSAWAVAGDDLCAVERTRILLGKDYQLATPDPLRQQRDIQALVEEAIRTESVPRGLPTQGEAEAVQRALDFLRRERVEVRVWTDGFLHAKAYLLGQSVGVGSANLTAGGLLANRELVMWREDYPVRTALQQWFTGLWESPTSRDYKAELIAALERTTFGGYEYTPYQVLIRTLASRYGTERPPSLEAATFTLHWFQEEAVFRLVQMLEQPAHGALLADAVGLGKTYMALGVIHHVLYNLTRATGSGPPVLVLVPASLIPDWDRVLRKHGLRWACEIRSLQSLDREEDVSDLLGAQLVVIDEAHRLRGKGVWYRQVMEILAGGAPDKRVLLLTATPINTSMRDLVAMLQVLTKNRRSVYAPAIADFEAYLRRVEQGQADPFPILDRSVVRRSRSDIVRAYEERKAAGLMRPSEAPKLPERSLFHQDYRYATDASGDVFTTFADTLRALELAPYDLDPFRVGATLPLDEDGQPIRQANSLAALVAAGLFKRFESSLAAIRLSLSRLDVVLRRSAEMLQADPPRLLRLDQSAAARQLVTEERDGDVDAGDFDERWEAVLREMPPVEHADELDLPRIGRSIAHDRDSLRRLRDALPAEGEDGKAAALRALFATGGRLRGKRVLLFTQFRDTAVYFHRWLGDDAWRGAQGVGGVALLHGGSDPDVRHDVAASFDPDQAGEDAMRAMRDAAEPPQLLVSTDILAEGHNLQLAEAVVNLDLPWNPQVVVQRAGRVDRLGSPHKRVTIGSFVPEEGLERHLGLIQTLDRRFRLIHLLGLGDEPVMKLRGDIARLSFEQMRRLYRDDVSVLDEMERTWTLGSTDFMRAPLEAFLHRHAVDELQRIPYGVQSIKRLPAQGWDRGPGVFISLEHDGESFWRFYPRRADGWGPAYVEEVAIFRAIGCSEGEPRRQLDDPFPGPGGVIDWELLHRAAAEVADELSRRRATAAIQRGASERSRQMREQIREIAANVGEVERVDDVLDRLEEVRVEDYDHRPELTRVRGLIAAARKADVPVGQRHDLLADIATAALALFGPPVGESEAGSDVSVSPTSLRLVSWEVLVDAPPRATGQQLFMP